MAKRASSAIIGSKRFTSNVDGESGFVRCTVTRSLCAESGEAKAFIRFLEISAGLRTDVAVGGLAVRIHRDKERSEVFHPEFPETLGHQVLEEDILDLLHLDRFDARRAADDRQVDPAELRQMI